MKKIIKLHLSFRDAIVRNGVKLGDKMYGIGVANIKFDFSYFGFSKRLTFILIKDTMIMLHFADGSVKFCSMASVVDEAEYANDYDLLDYIGESLSDYFDAH